MYIPVKVSELQLSVLQQRDDTIPFPMPRFAEIVSRPILEQVAVGTHNLRTFLTPTVATKTQKGPHNLNRIHPSFLSLIFEREKSYCEAN